MSQPGGATAHKAATTARPSLEDVAALAGVSTATVSRALRGISHVAPATRQRVTEAARALAYVSSPQAAGLASGRTYTIAAVVPSLTRWCYSHVVAGVTDVVRDGGYEVLLYPIRDLGEQRRFFDRMPLARRVDGVVTCHMPLTDEHVRALSDLDLPRVAVGPPVTSGLSISVDEDAAMQSAVNHLLHQGHKRIGYLAGEPDEHGLGRLASPLRRQGFATALRAAGVDFDRRLYASGRESVQGGAAAMAALLSGPVLPTAVVAEHDELALGAVMMLRRAGMQVPADVSVIGMDDHDVAEAVGLSMVSQNYYEQGSVAGRCMLERLRITAAGPPQPLSTAGTQLVLRGSTAPPRRNARRAVRGTGPAGRR